MVLLVFVVVLLVEGISGEEGQTGRAVAEAALVLVFALVVLLLAAGVGSRNPTARTPALLWHVLLLPIGFSMLGQGTWLPGTVVLLVAVAGLVSVWQAIPMDERERR